jgi:hypothetical protein
MDAEATAIFDALDDEMTRRQRAAIGTDQSAALARVWENTAKVALIKAVSAAPRAPVIRGVDAQWAREVVDHCVATLLIQAERHLADNEHEANHKKVLRLLDAAGAAGLTRSQFYRKTHFLGDRRDAVVHGCRARIRRLPGHADLVVRGTRSSLPGRARRHHQAVHRRQGQRRQGGGDRRGPRPRISPADDNEADAIAILLWAIETQGGVR